MFNKKEKCKRCGEKFDKKYSYCPYCSNKIDSNNEENEKWGILGRNDLISSPKEIKLPMGINALFNSILKNLNKEFSEQLNRNHSQTGEEIKKIKRDGISISISTIGNGAPKIKVTQLGGKPELKTEREVKKQIKQNIFTKEKIKEFTGLEREEPKTNVRRLSNKVIYELEMPGVKSMSDISIIKLENSIEIKAISKKKAYSKIIPINLPVINYALSEGKLILELGIKN
jgi:HSP20 family molecular chaperone IbpA